MIRPLNVSLRALAPDRRVYVRRYGLVFPYPAILVRDMANDMWIGPEDDVFEPTEYDRRRADAVCAHTPALTVRSKCAALWPETGAHVFALWWESLDPQADGLRNVAAAASYAARHVVTWSLFLHRNEVDTSGANA